MSTSSTLLELCLLTNLKPLVTVERWGKWQADYMYERGRAGDLIYHSIIWASLSFEVHICLSSQDTLRWFYWSCVLWTVLKRFRFTWWSVERRPTNWFDVFQNSLQIWNFCPSRRSGFVMILQKWAPQTQVLVEEIIWRSKPLTISGDMLHF